MKYRAFRTVGLLHDLVELLTRKVFADHRLIAPNHGRKKVDRGRVVFFRSLVEPVGGLVVIDRRANASGQTGTERQLTLGVTTDGRLTKPHGSLVKVLIHPPA